MAITKTLSREKLAELLDIVRVEFDHDLKWSNQDQRALIDHKIGLENELAHDDLLLGIWLGHIVQSCYLLNRELTIEDLVKVFAVIGWTVEG